MVLSVNRTDVICNAVRMQVVFIEQGVLTARWLTLQTFALKIFPITYAHSPLHTDTFSIVHEAERTRTHQQHQNDMNLNVCIRTKFVEANMNLAKWIETESSFFQYFCSLRN